MPRHARSLVAAVVGLIATSLACSETSTEPSRRFGPPPGWSTVGVGPGYSLGTDANGAHGGSRSLVIAGTDTNRLRFSGVGQFIRADDYRGRRIQFRAWIRQSNVVGASSGLWMRVDGPGFMQAFDNFAGRPQLGTAGWHEVEILLDVPTDAIGIAFGALMSGRGELFVDDMTVVVVPADGPSTNLLIDPVVSSDSATVAVNYAARAKAPINLDFEAR